MVVPAISFACVSRKFASAQGPDIIALKDISFGIRKNEFVAVVGPSGCGKSTVLRLIAGLISATAGRVSIYDVPVSGPRDLVSVVFQKPTLLPWLDVLSNVTFPARHKYGRVGEEERRLALDLLRLVGLSDFVRSWPDELSGGMQQRCALARALLLDPDILLMDEPFSALDALTREEMSFELLRIWIERPKTVVFVTHSISEALLLSDRVIVMSARPGSVSDVVDVPLARPRCPSVLSDPKFHELSARIRAKIFMRQALV
jgi:NitT/TauT family transport system ATP-binding protein